MVVRVFVPAAGVGEEGMLTSSISFFPHKYTSCFVLSSGIQLKVMDHKGRGIVKQELSHLNF